MSNERPDMAGFRKKALKDPEVRAEYESLGPIFRMKRQMIALRKQAGLTQEQMAEKLGTKKSNISRLESLNSDVSPRLATLEDYARVLGYSVTVGFEPTGDHQG
jgi:DNA-binding XRE family transcriptional regulator